MPADLRAIVEGHGVSASLLDSIPMQRQFQVIPQRAALQSGMLQHELHSRTVPDIFSGQAARGAFGSGATVRKRGRAIEDVGQADAVIEQQTNEQILNLLMTIPMMLMGRQF